MAENPTSSDLPYESRLPRENNAVVQLIIESKLVNPTAFLDAVSGFFELYVKQHSSIPVSDDVSFNVDGSPQDIILDQTTHLDEQRDKVRGTMRCRNIYNPHNKSNLIFGETDLRRQFLRGGFEREVRGEFSSSTEEERLPQVGYDIKLSSSDDQSRTRIELRLRGGWILIEYPCTALGRHLPEGQQSYYSSGIYYYPLGQDYDVFTEQEVRDILQEFGLL